MSLLTEGKTGLELLQEAIAGKLPTGPLLKSLGCALAEATDGFARFELTATDELHSPAYALHGGVLQEVTVAYRTWGRLDASASNAVLVCHA